MGGVERGTLEIGRAPVAVLSIYRAVYCGPMVTQLIAEGSDHITLPKTENPR